MLPVSKLTGRRTVGGMLIDRLGENEEACG